jgi:hypothetical protein
VSSRHTAVDSPLAGSAPRSSRSSTSSLCPSRWRSRGRSPRGPSSSRWRSPRPRRRPAPPPPAQVAAFLLPCPSRERRRSEGRSRRGVAGPGQARRGPAPSSPPQLGQRRRREDVHPAPASRRTST